MIPTTQPPQSPIVAVDRAVPGRDQRDNRALTSRRPLLDDGDVDPLNRRGRRHYEALARRSARSVFRTARRQKIEELADRNA